MVKIKAKIKNGAIEAQVTPEKGDSFIDYELDHLKRLRCRGFFKPVKVKGKSLVYVGPQGFTLREKFAQPMSEVEVFRYIEQMLNTFRKLTVNKMNPNSLILNMDFVYINPSTDELQFLYLPTYSGGSGADGFGFLKDMLYSIPTPQPLPYIKKFESFLYTLSGFNWEQIEGYIKKEHPMVVKVITDSNYGQEGFPAKQIVNNGGNGQDIHGINRNNGGNGQDIQKNIPGNDGKIVGQNGIGNNGSLSWVINNNYSSGGPGDDPRTVQLRFDDDETVMQESDGTVFMEEAARAVLHQCSNSTDFNITKPNFKIGRKMGECDLVINGNKYIGRHHCEINQLGSSFYLKDCVAKNGTFINGNKLNPGSEQELHDGDEVKLADEKFIFSIKK